MEQEDNRSKTEQVIRECTVKASQVIIQSRSQITSGKGKINKWFNLELEDIESLSEELYSWRTNIYLPLYINILSISQVRESEIAFLEQWKISFEPNTTASDHIEIPTLYKKLVILIRSIYIQSRLMPAYKLHRHSIKHKLSSTKFSYELKRDSNSHRTLDNPVEFVFESVPSAYGKFTVKVTYSDIQLNIKQLTSLAVNEALINSQVLIQDYTPNAASSSSSFTIIPGATPVIIETKDIKPSSVPTSPSIPISVSSSRPIGIPQSISPPTTFSPPNSVTTTIPMLSQTPPFRISAINSPEPLHQVSPPFKFSKSGYSSASTDSSEPSPQVSPFVTGAFSPPLSLTSPSYPPAPMLNKAFSTTPPFQPSTTPPNYSYPSTSTFVVKSKSPHKSSFRLSVSPFKDASIHHQDSLPIQKLSITESHNLQSAPPLPATYLSTTDFESAPKYSLLQEGPTDFFAPVGSRDSESEIGYFVAQCQQAPPLRMFSDSNDYERPQVIQVGTLFDQVAVLQSFNLTS